MGELGMGFPGLLKPALEGEVVQTFETTAKEEQPVWRGELDYP
jgi:hypothetical protein